MKLSSKQFALIALAVSGALGALVQAHVIPDAYSGAAIAVVTFLAHFADPPAKA